MIKGEREKVPAKLESFTFYVVERAKKLAEKMKIQEALDLSDRENQFATIFLAERIVKANQYFYLQENKKVSPVRKGFLTKIAEKIVDDEQKLTNLACRALERASKIIIEEELRRPRGQTIYLTINDLSARINQENDCWQGNKYPLANYQLKEFGLWQWGVKWREKLEGAQEESGP